jgi:hypothetical protein
MLAINHRLDHLPENTAALLLRFTLRLFTGFHASWNLLTERNAALADVHDDIRWEDGAPEKDFPTR